MMERGILDRTHLLFHRWRLLPNLPREIQSAYASPRRDDKVRLSVCWRKGRRTRRAL